MTIEELKKLDKQIRDIPYICGNNFPLFRKIIREEAEKHQISASEVIMQYTAWKWKK